MAGEAFRRRRGGWPLEREADAAKAKTQQQNLPSRPEQSERLFC